MERSLIEYLLADERVSIKAKLEAFLATSLKLRPVSQVTIPAELPHGIEMGKEIDRIMQPQMKKLQSIHNMGAKVKAVQIVRKLLENNFENIVEDSSEYKALYEWSTRLNLKNNQIRVRPTVHEIYFFVDREYGSSVQKLMREREKIRHNVQKKPRESLDSIHFAYPEEFEPRWLQSLGKLLGYPDCCTKQYANDRVNRINVEARASQQLLEAVKDKEVDTHTYFTGYFFPCEPRCVKALDIGYKWHDTFSELNEDLGKKYQQNINVNTELVLRQPELINQYLSQFESKEN